MKNLFLTKTRWLVTIILLTSLGITSAWGQSCTSYNESTKDTQTTITNSNAANGSAGEISWSGDGTCSSSQWRFAASKSVTFTVSSGYQITQIAFTSTSSSDYYGTWSSTSGSKSTSGGTTTFTSINATSVTLSTSTAARMKTCNVTYEAVGGGCSTDPSVGASSNSSINVTGGTVSCTGITKGDCDIDEWGFVYGTATEPTGNAQKVSSSKSTSNVLSFNKTLTGLDPNVKYYVRAYAKIGSSTFYGSETNFTTKTITASSSNTTYGTVSRSKMVITGSPKSGGQYASPAYTVTGSTPANATTVTQSGNTFTVTSTSTTNITVTINFEAIPTYTVSFSTGTGNPSQADITEASAGEGITLPAGPTPTCSGDGWSFAGWKETSAVTSETTVAPTLLSAGSTFHPTGNVTLYAVYKKGTLSNNYEKITTSAALTSGSNYVIARGTSLALDASNYYMEDGDGYFGTTSISVSDNTISNPSAELIWEISGNNTDGYSFYNAKQNLYIGYSTTEHDLYADGTKHSDYTITFTSSNFYVQSKSENSYYFATWSYSTGSGSAYFFEIKNSSAYIVLYKQKGTNTYFSNPTCCTPPASPLSITGSNTVSMDATLSPGTSGGNGGTVTWSVTSGTGTATINPSTGVLTPGSVGTVTIHAHQDANEKCAQDAEKEITILAATVPVSGVTVDPTSKAIVVGETFTITPTVSPSNATDKSVSWTSSASGKASVSNGTVTGVAKGSATITCTTTDGGRTATTAVTVYNLTVLAQDEDGTDISGVSGITASHTGKALSAGVGSTKYVFKTWKYAAGGQGGLDAIPSATSTSTTLTGTPTGDVTVIAEFYKPIVVHYWNNGVDVYDEEVARGTNVTPTYSGVSSGGTGNYGPCDATHIYYYGWSKTDIGSTPDDEATVGETYSSVTADVHYYAVWTDVDAEDYSSNYTGGTQVEGCAAYTLTIGKVSDIAAMKIGRTSGNHNGSYTFTIPQGTTTLTLRARGFGSTDVGSIDFFDAGPSITPTDITPTAYGGFGGNGTSFTLDPEDDLLTYTITGCTSQSYDITVSTSSSNRIVIYDINTSTGGGGGGGGGGSGDAEYITRCCTELATIGGAEKSKTYNSVTLQWNDIANVSSWAVTCKKKSDGTSAGTPSAITTVSTKKNITFTGLDQYTDYVFTISATAASGYCNTDDVVEIKTPCVAPSSLSISSSSNKWDFCAGESMTLTVNGTNVSASATYQWQKHNGSAWVDIANATSASYTVANMAAANAGQYRCTITNPGSCAATTEGAWVRLWQLHLGDDDIDFTYVSGTTGSNSTVHLNSDTHYEFKLKDNNGGWFGLNDKTITATISAFALNGSGANVNVTSGLEGNYTFTINYSDKNNPTIAVTYPVGNQPSGRSIWFDKSVVTGWNSEGTSDLYYRIGKSTNHTNNTKTGGTAWTLVPGTDKFYTTKTMAYDGFEAWAISNNAAWCDNSDDTHSIYGNATDSYKITKAIDFQKYVVGASGVTIVPTSSHNTDGNGCNYWYVSKTDGMLTHKATITPPTNGTITIANAAQSLEATTTTADLPHRTILTVTATPEPGYQLSSLTVNGEAFTSGNEHILSADATIAAMFTAKTITITWDGNGGNTPSPTESSYTYNGSTVSLATVTHATKLFAGWFTDPSDGTQITEIGTTNKPTDDVTYYAHWVDGNTVYFNAGAGTVSPDHATQTSVGSSVSLPTPTPTCSGWTFQGWKIGSEQTEVTTLPEGLVTGSYVPESATVQMYAVYKKTFEETTPHTSTYDWDNTVTGWSTSTGISTNKGTQGVGSSKCGEFSANGSYVIFNTKVKVKNFSLYMRRSSNNTKGTGKIQKSTDGTNWTDVLTWSMSDIAQDACTQKSTTFDGSTEYYVQFFYVADGSAIRYIDNVSITYNTVDNVTHYATSPLECSQVATPLISPEGDTYTGAQSITITCATAGATIKYTTDGTDPSSSNGTTIATGSSFTLSCSSTVKAIAYKDGMADSDIASETYTIKVPDPTFSPDGGDFKVAQSVSLSSAFAGTTVYYEYTTDGSEPSDPTSSSTAYSGTPISVAVGQTVRIKAIGINGCATNSDIVSKTFRVGWDFELVTDEDDLNVGDKIVILSGTTNALSTYNVSGNNRTSSSDFDISETTVTAYPPNTNSATTVQVITLAGEVGAWKLMSSNTQWLNCPSDGKLTTVTTDGSGAEDLARRRWSIDIGSSPNYYATIQNNQETASSIKYGTVFAAYASDQVSPVKIYAQTTTDPTIAIQGSLTAFTACPAEASAAQSFYVKGVNLSTNNIVVTAPTGYEVSLNGSSYNSTVELIPDAGKVVKTQVYIRIASGNTAGATLGTTITAAVSALSLSETLSVSGTVSANDTYVDRMHGRADQYGCGSYSAPNLSDGDKTSGTDCQKDYYDFQGWVISTDVNPDGTLKSGATVISAGDSMTATGATYYSIWGEDVE